MKTELLPILGRAVPMDFPELNLASVPAKIDTGAYRSAIHAEDMQIVTKNGVETLQFNLLKGHNSSPTEAAVETTEFDRVAIENSFGDREDRYEVKLVCVINGKRIRASFTLANRSKKKYPILVGRKLTNKRFLVDTSMTQINRTKLKEQFHVELPQDEEEN